MPREKDAAVWVTAEGSWIRDNLTDALTELQTRPSELHGPYKFGQFGNDKSSTRNSNNLTGATSNTKK